MEPKQPAAPQKVKKVEKEIIPDDKQQIQTSDAEETRITIED
jgi:hypothetical protein